LSKKSATNRKSLNSNREQSKNDLEIQQSFAPPNKPTYTQQSNDYQSYAQIGTGNSKKKNTSLERIEQLLEKHSELTNMIMLLL